MSRGSPQLTEARKDEIIHACDHPCVTPLRGDCPENWIFSCFDIDFCAWGEPREVDA